nr:protein phosphatase 1 regulatory subunit 11 isoform X1 [Equus caballus]
MGRGDGLSYRTPEPETPLPPSLCRLLAEPAHCHITAELIRRRLRFNAFRARKGKGGLWNTSHPEEESRKWGWTGYPQGWGSGGPGGRGKKKENRSLTIKLRKRKPEKKVEWTSDTVDNEHMGRRSSKCCCIYEKPRAFGESSTESDEEEEEGCGHTHCVRGHRKGRRRATPGPSPTTPPQPPDPSQPPPGPMQH